MMRRFFFSALLLLVVTVQSAFAQEAAEPAISGADTAWLLVSAALVLLMTPGLAFFYGGLVRRKNALNTMMMSFIAIGVMGVIWALVGYSIAFGEGGAYFGDFSFLFLKGVLMEPNGTIPDILFMGFQGTFAIITAALISGAVVGRMRFKAYILFIAAWGLLVYAPVCHWVWGGGWLGEMGALDFAGGAVVHINAGIAAVVVACMLGTRRDYGSMAFVPHNVPFVLLGAGLLWFGWFGFNGGSALAADGIAAVAMVNTLLAPAAALVAWTFLDYIHTSKGTAVGVATGIVVGLVAITPAAGFISPFWAMVLGAIAAVPSFYAIRYRVRTRLDDSLDVFAAHGVGGISGALLTGVFASAAIGGADGLLFGNSGQLGVQAVSILAVLLYSGIVTGIIVKVLDLTMNIRATTEDEDIGMDISHHGEAAYNTSEGAVLITE